MSKLLQLYIGGGTAKWLQYYIGGGMPKWLQYYIGGEGSLGTPKSDYVICARPLRPFLILPCRILLLAQIPLCDSGTKRFGSSSEQFDWLGTDHHCAQFCFEKSWSDLLQGFTDNCHRAATRIQTPSARDGNLDKCGNVIPFWRKFPVPTEIGSWP